MATATTTAKPKAAATKAAAKTKKPAAEQSGDLPPKDHNGPDGEYLSNLFRNLEALDAEEQKIRARYKAQLDEELEGLRDDRKAYLQSAGDKGYKPKIIRQKLKERKLRRDADGLRDKLKPEQSKTNTIN